METLLYGIQKFPTGLHTGSVMKGLASPVTSWRIMGHSFYRKIHTGLVIIKLIG